MQWIRFMGAGVLALAGAAPAWADASADAPADAAVPTAEALPFVIPQAMPAVALMRYEAAPPRVRLAGASDEPSVAVGLERLEQSRGGTDTVSNEASLRGVTSGNAAVNVSTGANIIDGAAFSNAAGIPVVIQNSGANVLIQNATVVNLQLR